MVGMTSSYVAYIAILWFYDAFDNPGVQDASSIAAYTGLVIRAILLGVVY